MAPSEPLRIGYVPEHFSTPLHFAKKYHGLQAELIPFPSGTGHMITSLRANEIDIGIGLTEGWIAGLGKAHSENRNGGYKLLGRYVETPLCWAISTGAKRDEFTGIPELKGKKIGVSRIGSGSYVMGFVLADAHHWLSKDASSSPSAAAAASAPFDVVPLQTFEALRNAVNDGTADFFMWEHFTSKRYYDNGEIKKLGQIYTPWPSWEIVVQPGLMGDSRVEEVLEQINLGIAYFRAHADEAVGYIAAHLDYSEDDAREWLTTVRFADDVRGVKASTVQSVVETLQTAGVLGPDVDERAVNAMMAIRRKE